MRQEEEQKKTKFVERLDDVIDVKCNPQMNTSNHSNTFGTPRDTDEKVKVHVLPSTTLQPIEILYQDEVLKPEFHRGSFPRS